MNAISKNGLYDLLASIKGATIVSLVTLSDVRMRKTNNPLIGHSVQKQTYRVCQFGYSYENAVNNRLEKQGDERTFVAESLAWGEWAVPNKIISHKGEFYGRFYSMKGQSEHTTVIYFVDGVVANKEQMAIIKEFEQVSKSGSGRQSAEGLEENQVKPFNAGFKTILTIKVNGEEYQVEQETAEVTA